MNVLSSVFNFLSERNRWGVKLIIIGVIASLSIMLSTLLEFDVSEFSFVVLTISRLPFMLIAEALKALALLSGVTNYIAILLLILIGGVPLIVAILRLGHKSTVRERLTSLIFAGGLTGLIIYTVYVSINPHLITNRFELDESLFGGEKLDSIYQFIDSIYQTNLVWIMIAWVMMYGLDRLVVYMRHNKLSLFNAAKLLQIINRISLIALSIFMYSLYPIFIYLTLTNLDALVVIVEQVLTYLIAYTIMVCFLMVLKNLDRLLANFRNQQLFDASNVYYLKKTSNLLFVVLGLSLAQIILVNGYKAIFISSYTDVMFTFDFPLQYIILALVFYLLSLIMHQAYEIYKDQRLTI